LAGKERSAQLRQILAGAPDRRARRRLRTTVLGGAI
jgi:hypothetical protein